ncbi:MAG: NB-ARC domain-containing protein, partial [Candidatus Rickettsiella isopodorum]
MLIKNETQQFYHSLNVNTVNEIERPIKQRVSSRNKRAPDDETLVGATVKGDYTYWLSQEDIAEIARIEYNQFLGVGEGNAEFEILGSLTQLYMTSELFQLKVQTYQLNTARLTLIINLENLHWVTLVISYKYANYIAYYVDSKNNPIPSRYSQMLIETFQIQPLSLSPGLTQQQDHYNCGIWALENAADLSKMIDQNESLHSIVNELNRPRNKEYFDIMRVFFSEKLCKDPIWLERHPSFLPDLQKKLELPSHDVRPTIDKIEPDPKRFKAMLKDEKEKVTILLETFVETFMSAFIKTLGIYHLLAKDKLLTEEALKTELKTGITGALIGISIAESLVGSIPSVVASLRMISNKYFAYSKNKAQKITRAFSVLKPDYLDLILAEAVINIFYSFESQFMQVTDKAGDKVAMEKLAEDAVERVFSYIEKTSDEENRIISKEIIEKGVVKGSSEKFFDPKLKNIKQARVRVAGYDVQDKHKHDIRTVSLYEKTGLVEFDINDQSMKFYAPKKSPRNRYGYRRLFDWEKETNGALKECFKEEYIEKYFSQSEDLLPFISKNYDYVLHSKTNHAFAEAQRILNKIKNHYSSQFIVRQPESKKPIYFNLREPVKNFSGRIEILKKLHNILISERTTAIVPTWFALSLSGISSPLSPSDSDSSQASSGSQLSISGLGGIGKTQLALRYAELYAEHYDHNVLWIDAETKENLIYAFQQLAIKLQITTQDQYDQEQHLKYIGEIYDYFSDKKSLFIFDNVEDYHTIESYLPKSTPGNKPTVLITSRYSNWNNIATTLSLSVFTGQETEELIKKSLDLEDNQYERIMELNQLLQGLPLALQQALAYIKLKRNTDASFSIFHYIELYKRKQQELLKFNFSDYANDPYLKTVFTTWIITLDKIKSYEIGQGALNILNIMAYLSPDSISAAKFFQVIQLNRSFKLMDLNEIMNLLSSYSMINPKDNEDKYSIHRLVQQVIRLNIEQDSSMFEKTVENTQLFLWHWDYAFRKDPENVFHYLHFLIYMSEHTELVTQLVYGHPEKKFFDSLILQDAKYCQYFIDLAYLKFPKKKFLRFLGDAIAYYIKLGCFFYLSEILNYIENKWRLGIFSKENVKYISEYFLNLKNPTLKFIRYSTNAAKKQNQQQSVSLFFRFQSKIFGTLSELYDSCPSHSLKRSVCALSKSDQDRIKEISNSRTKAHFKKIEQVSRFISSALMTKDTLSALIQGHFNEVAINFGLMTSSLFFGKISNSLLTQGKNLASDASLLEKNLGLENKKVLSILFNENVSSMGKR